MKILLFIHQLPNPQYQHAFLALTNLANFNHLRSLIEGQRYPIPVYVYFNEEEDASDI